MKKKLTIAFGVIILLLLVTNPGKEDFSSYCESQGIHRMRPMGRVSNYLLFSKYQVTIDYDTKSYYGVFKNFIEAETTD